MAWTIPSLDDLVQRSRTAFSTYLPGSDATVWPNNITISAKVIAGRVWEAMQYQSFIAKQASPITATGTYLERHCQAYGITRKTDLTADGDVLLTDGTYTTLIPAGTQFQSASGYTYTSVLNTYIDSDGAATVSVVADLSGSDSNLGGGEALTMLAVITGAPSTGNASSAGIYGGTILESDDDLRARLLFRLRTPPHAGSESDYIRWCLENDGVTRAWVEGNAFGPGTVAVFFAMDDQYADGIPSAADVAVVQAYVDLLKPITADVRVAAPAADPLYIEVTGLSPFTTSVLEKVRAEVEAAIKEKAQVSTYSNTEYFRASWIWQAISNATGEKYHTVKIPVDDYPIAVGTLPTYDVTKFVVSG